MATYTIKINERTKKGKKIVSYLRRNGVIADYKKIPVCDEPWTPEMETALQKALKEPSIPLEDFSDSDLPWK